MIANLWTPVFEAVIGVIHAIDSLWPDGWNFTGSLQPVTLSVPLPLVSGAQASALSTLLAAYLLVCGALVVGKVLQKVYEMIPAKAT